MTPAAIIVIPPFAGVDRPALGPHVLQACAKAYGLRVEVLYANIAFARLIGVELYESICFAPTAELLGERIFATSAFDGDIMATTADGYQKGNFRRVHSRDPLGSYGARLGDLQAQARRFTASLAQQLAETDAAVIGCTTTFEQNLSALAILRGVKDAAPGKVTILGGANCDGDMACGLAAIGATPDYVFSGESEATFPRFLADLLAGKRPSNRVVAGQPCRDMDGLPTPDFSEYYAQASLVRPEEFDIGAQVWLPYEASRGCWWGEKSHCTFCGINGSGMAFRQKSAGKVLGELSNLLSAHPNRKVLMVDNIMPLSYFDDLLPALERQGEDLHIFYEQKANLTLEKVGALRRAGVKVIQPGIEALSTPLLKLMKKGVSAAQNIALLRYALAWDISVNWNLLHDFPGDEEDWYLDTLGLLPLIRHLHPPTGVCQLSIDRFSPYFDRAEAFEVTNVRPMPAYDEIYPPGVDTGRVAYHFVADYASARRRDPDLANDLETEVDAWRKTWTAEPNRPLLHIGQLAEDTFVLVDSRFSTQPRFRFLTRQQATLALSVQRPDAWPDPLVVWAVKAARVAVHLDGALIPLATAPPDLFQEFDVQRLSSSVGHPSWSREPV